MKVFILVTAVAVAPLTNAAAQKPVYPPPGFQIAAAVSPLPEKLQPGARVLGYDASGKLTGSSVLRLDLAYLFPADIRSLLSRAGFTNIDIAGGFDGRPLAHDGDELVITASA